MADALMAQYGVSVSTQTVKRAFDGRGFTVKQVHRQSDLMNELHNKQKRQDYIIKLLSYQSAGKKIYYVDETNYNMVRFGVLDGLLVGPAPQTSSPPARACMSLHAYPSLAY